MRTGLVISFAVMMVALPLSAQTPVGRVPPAQPQPTEATPPVPRVLPLPSMEQRPAMLLQAQQLAILAYPSSVRRRCRSVWRPAVTGPSCQIPLSRLRLRNAKSFP